MVSVLLPSIYLGQPSENIFEGQKFKIDTIDFSSGKKIFHPESNEVLNMLGYPNYNNVEFFSRSNRIRLFFAEWDEENKIGTGAVSHTPDICWIGIGWKLVKDHGVNHMEYFDIDGNNILCNLRVFENEKYSLQELVVWMTNIDGYFLNTSFEVDNFLDSKLEGDKYKNYFSKKLMLKYLKYFTVNRRKSTGFKQFLRISCPVDNSVNDSLENLKYFLSNNVKIKKIESSEILAGKGTEG